MAQEGAKLSGAKLLGAKVFGCEVVGCKVVGSKLRVQSVGEPFVDQLSCSGRIHMRNSCAWREI